MKLDLWVSDFSEKQHVSETLYSDVYFFTDGADSPLTEIFDRVMVKGEHLTVGGTSAQYFYSLDQKDNENLSKIWYEFQLNDEIVFTETQDRIVFKVVLKTINQFVSPILRNTITIHFKRYESETSSFTWLKKDLKDERFYSANFRINNLKHKTSYSDVTMEDNSIQKDMSAFSQVYRMVIDFSLPELNNPNYNLKDFNGIPMIFKDADSGEIIQKFTILKSEEIFGNGTIPISGGNTSTIFSSGTSGQKPILGERNTIIRLGEEIICNGDGSVWFGDDIKSGENEESKLNLYGQIFFIKKIDENTFRQVFEFCGKDFEKHTNIVVEIKIPVIQGNENKFKTLFIKNISFSSDSFADNKLKMISSKIKEVTEKTNKMRHINPMLYHFSKSRKNLLTFGGLTFGKQKDVVTVLAKNIKPFKNTMFPFNSITWKG
jgi:hypothetical protein